jgi:hypothetical protein
VILAHRLLKNSVPEKEYILETESFFQLAGASPRVKQEARTERYEDLGEVRVRVSYPAESIGVAQAAPRSFLSKLKMSWRNDLYYLKRLFSKAERPFQNIGVLEPAASSETALFAAKTHLSQFSGKTDR